MATFQRRPDVPPVAVTRLQMPALPLPRPHTHAFLVLGYFEHGGGVLGVGEREWDVRAGDAFTIPPGEVVSARAGSARGWAVFFPPDLLGGHDAVLSWRVHPLLAPFAHAGERLRVPPQEHWAERFETLERELRERSDGFAEAAVAHVTLLLVSAARLAETPLVAGEPLLEALFAFIERRFREPVSLREAASELGLTPGHLTTVVRRRTGRTVLDWIVERRMAEARRLLVETGDTAQAIGAAVGYADPGYFGRVFRRAHGMSPMSWRAGSRPMGLSSTG